MIRIAIDGPSGAGKSTVAKMIAEKLDITYLDTGAMYRAFALYIRRRNIFSNEPQVIIPLIDEVDIDVQYKNRTQKVLLNGEDVTVEIRQHDMSKAASDISMLPEVRRRMVDLQREIAKGRSVVMDGRDIASHVLPDAEVKIYLTASPEVRAKRRCQELATKGEDVEYGQLLSDINARDKNDTTRKFAPLRKVGDATEIDCTNLSIDEVVSKIEEVIKKNVL